MAAKKEFRETIRQLERSGRGIATAPPEPGSRCVHGKRYSFLVSFIKAKGIRPPSDETRSQFRSRVARCCLFFDQVGDTICVGASKLRYLTNALVFL